MNAVLKAQAGSSLYKMRSRQLESPIQKVTKARFWRAMVCMRLTSQQRSGPRSHIARFVALSDFPLSYAATLEASRVDRFIAKTLRSAGGIRFCDSIGRDLADNLVSLEGGQWMPTLALCNSLAEDPGLEREIEVADFVDDRFKGFGPKQARNLLQALGLTRYEIPIDSRMIRWLNRNGFPLHL